LNSIQLHNEAIFQKKLRGNSVQPTAVEVASFQIFGDQKVPRGVPKTDKIAYFVPQICYIEVRRCQKKDLVQLKKEVEKGEETMSLGTN
jgi:hypothetical protein